MNFLYSWSLRRALIIIIPLFLLNWVGVQYSLYGVLWWWDVMTHFLGGIFIGFFLLAIGARFHLVDRRTWLRNWILAALVIFIGWEVYEILVNLIIPTYKMDYLDTAHDIINDSLGALVAYHWYKHFNAHNRVTESYTH